MIMPGMNFSQFGIALLFHSIKLSQNINKIAMLTELFSDVMHWKMDHEHNDNIHNFLTWLVHLKIMV